MKAVARNEPLVHKPRSAGDILTFGINNADINFTASLTEASVLRKTPKTPPPSVTAVQQAVENGIPSDVVRHGDNFDTFLCHQPVNPHMRHEQSRLQTFFDNYSIWKAKKICTTPQEIAKAGFFFMGKRDKVKCWYCNGILQGWEPDDNAWEEHAKWYPLCEFLLQQKGVRFVYDLVKKFPDLERPALPNPASVDIIQNIVQPSISIKTTSQPKPNICTFVVDPMEKQKEQAEKMETEMKTSEHVQQARDLDFGEGEIKLALKRQYEIHDHGFSTLTSLIESILSLKETTA